MKTKDLVYIILAAVIFSVAGILGYKQLAPKGSSSKQVQVEVVTPIDSNFDQGSLNVLTDPNHSRDFTPSIDLTTGLGNTKPFNPI